MKLIVPTVTAKDPHGYRSQMELVCSISDYVHIDLSSKDFFGADSLIDCDKIYLEDGITYSVHLMYTRPLECVKYLLGLKEPPRMIILHVESEALEVLECIKIIKDAGVLLGLAILQNTKINDYSELITLSAQVLIFSGNLGKHGGTADLRLVDKIAQTIKIKSSIEIAWDGGVSLENIRELSEAGVDIFYVGGAIHKAEDPAAAIEELGRALA